MPASRQRKSSVEPVKFEDFVNDFGFEHMLAHLKTPEATAAHTPAVPPPPVDTPTVGTHIADSTTMASSILDTPARDTPEPCIAALGSRFMSTPGADLAADSQPRPLALNTPGLDT